MSWTNVKLGELIVESRVAAKNPNANRRIKVRLFTRGVEKRPLENEKEGATKQFERKAGQFIYGKQNFHKGAFGIVPDELDGFETSADIPTFDIRNDCLAEWIYYYFKVGNRYLELEKLARGVGSKRIHPEQLSEIVIPLPPIGAQKVIINLFKTAELQSNNLSIELTHQLSLVKQLRQAFLREAMQGKLVPQDTNDEPASELLKKIKAEKEQLIKEKKIKKEKELPPIKPGEIPFEIPESWMWCRLGKISQSANNGLYKPERFYKPEGIISLRMFNIQDGKIVLNKARRLILTDSELEKYYLEKDDILINRVNGIDLVGKAAIIEDVGEPLVYESMNIRLRLIFKNEIASFINWLLLEKRARDYFFSCAKVANGQVSINQTHLGELLIPLPPRSEQHRIVIKLKQLMSFCDELEQSIKESQTQNEQLLQQVLREALQPKKDYEVKDEVSLVN